MLQETLNIFANPEKPCCDRTLARGLEALTCTALILSLFLMSPAFAEEAYSNEQTIMENVNADFIGQNAVLGGAIAIDPGNTIEQIKGSFIGNSADRNGGAIYNLGHIGQIIDSKFINNSVVFSPVQNNPMMRMVIQHNINIIASAIFNSGEINEIVNSSFVGNNVIYSESTVTDDMLEELVNMKRSRLSMGGNNVSQIGAAIYTNNNISIVADNGVSEFSGNYFQNSNGEKDYIAIYVDGYRETIRDTDIAEEMHEYDNNGILSQTQSTESENKISTCSQITGLQQAEKNDSVTTLSLIAKNNGKIIINDKISGAAVSGNLSQPPLQLLKMNVNDNIADINSAEDQPITYKLNIDGDSTGVVQINNNVEAKGSKGVLSLLQSPPKRLQNIDNATQEEMRAGDDGSGLAISETMREQEPEIENITGIVDISLSNTNLHLGVRDNVLDGNNLTLNSGVINMVNNQAGVSTLHNLTIAGNTSMVADVDLANKSMDRLTSKNYGEHNGILTVAGMNLLSDSHENRTEIFFAEQGLKDNVANAVTNLPSSSQTSAFTPIYKYDVNYDNRNDGGFFVFTRGSNKSVDSFNPAVLPTAVANQTGAYTTQNQTFNYAFQNSDNFMNIPYLERMAIKNQNKYALSPNGDATDVGVFSPIFTKPEGNSVWVKPYASFENVPLKNGPKVDNINYGTLIGFDSELKEVRGGFDRVMTYYLGYNGSYQSYRGVNSTQNGGLVGTTATFYKGNFFNATTLSVGASVGENDTMYGHEDFALLLAGIGNKTGYNLEFKDGRIILQPNLLLSYTFVNTFDYTNAAGVKIKSDPLNAIQIAPGVKLIGNTKSGWQPYASVSMVWNVLDKSKVTADDVKLPEMSIKPYVQYGLGVQKRFKDRFLGFGQAMVQNGGRNGVSLSFGLRMMLGK
ncbi:MAG: hypothetical protein NC408_05470 [Candidatus Gastranaerophilales bacterium]|nr:hypothetical protein [Candidatus Gastranaerophilales bacterium]MCM1073158.1 hypothetical protein [Bacteroides sp.]